MVESICRIFFFLRFFPFLTKQLGKVAFRKNEILGRPLIGELFADEGLVDAELLIIFLAECTNRIILSGSLEGEQCWSC